MKPEIKTEWVAALRSGEYLQGTSVLRRSDRRGNTYCCLGVLSDLAVKAQVATWVEDRSAFDISAGSQKGSCIPVGAVCDWAGLSNGTENNDPMGVLIGMNDGMNDGEGNYVRRSFNEIADWIEENL